MMLNFAEMKETDGVNKIPEGNHVFVLDTVGEAKKNKSGNIGFCMWFRKEGYKNVMQYIQMTNNVRDKQRIMNVITSFNLKLEQREYKPSEIYKMIEGCEGKKVEAEIVYKDDKFTADDGKVVEFKRPEIATLKPLSVNEEVFEADEDDLDELDLS